MVDGLLQIVSKCGLLVLHRSDGNESKRDNFSGTNYTVRLLVFNDSSVEASILLFHKHSKLEPDTWS